MMLIKFFKSVLGFPRLVETWVSNADPLPTTPLRRLGEPRNRTVSDVSQTVVLSPTCEAITMTMTGCNARVRISTQGTAAVVTDHRVLDGERVDQAVEPGSTVAVIAESAGSAGVLAVSELL